MPIQNAHLLKQLGLAEDVVPDELADAVGELLDDYADPSDSLFWSSLTWSVKEGVEDVALFTEAWVSDSAVDTFTYSLVKFRRTPVGLVFLNSAWVTGQNEVLGAVDLRDDPASIIAAILGEHFERIGIGVPSGLSIHATQLLSEESLSAAYWRSGCCKLNGREEFLRDFLLAIDRGEHV